MTGDRRRRLVREVEADRRACTRSAGPSASCASARRGRCPARAPTETRRARRLCRAPSRENGRPENARPARPCRRTRRRILAVAPRGLRGSRRSECARGAPPARFPGRNSMAPIHALALERAREARSSGRHRRPSAGRSYASGHGHDEVGLAQLPPRRERRRAAAARFGSPSSVPSATHCWRVWISASVSRRSPSNSPMPGLGLPRRHEPVLDRLGNLPRPLPRIVVGQEVERRRFAGPMAGGTVREEDRRDVLAVGHPVGRGLGSGLGRRCRRERQNAARNDRPSAGTAPRLPCRGIGNAACRNPRNQ